VLTGWLTPKFKTIADFRKDNGSAIHKTCRRFIEVCRRLNLFAHAVGGDRRQQVKAVNARGKNFTRDKLEADGSGRGEHRALPVGAGDSGPSGRRVGGSQILAACRDLLECWSTTDTEGFAGRSRRIVRCVQSSSAREVRRP
jgi:hypothetical protein